ncbi:hypothetical protein BKE38_10785 [Pseudoroseomonas deserti]|uniref:Uncharacterized protein n=1 Tax=Teichococcus deserti TaxID=1817963 RepID=A0A1V2H2X6_9PROT|nr:hypothetical protein [Pseudoroseomonas deserti]ONG54219.1 hypothetical protein BKE38_10785 [Pseudoroseomonas deserti]
MIYFAERLQLAVEGLARLAPRRLLLCGWMLTPRGAPPQLRVTAGDQVVTPVQSLAPPRPDVTLLQPDLAQVQGFLLVLDGVPEGAPLVLTLAAGGLSGRVNLRDPGINRDLDKAFARLPAALGFSLLRGARDDPARWPLLRHGYRAHGAFGGWLDALPQLGSAALSDPDGLLRHAATAATTGGEVMLGLRFAGRPQRGLEVELIALARLAAPDGAGDETAFVPLEDDHCTTMGATACLHARLPTPLLPRLVALELVAELRFDDERRWLRCRPGVVPLPAFLDAIAAQAGPEAEGSLAEALLRPVLARREAALAPRLAGLPPVPAAPAGAPLALVTGCDEPALLPLLEIVAAGLERRCGGLVLLGRQAEAAAQIFARRGRRPAQAARLAGPALAAAIAGDTPVVLLEAQRLGQAVIDQQLDALFAAPLQGAGLARLQALHDLAGCGDLSDSLARLRRDPRQPWQPPAQAWCRPLAGQMINDHLERLWTLAA